MHDTPENKIALSVIVPACNARRTLPHCLRALQEQTLRARAGMEVIAADGGSSDRTYEIALEFTRENPEVFFVQRRGNLNEAKEAALAAARGEFIAFCDAREQPPPDFYASLCDICAQNCIDFAGAGIWDIELRGTLVRREFLLSRGLPVRPGHTRDEQFAAYDTLRALVPEDELPSFCAGWVPPLHGICRREHRESRGGAAFYAKMIDLAHMPQTIEIIARADRGVLKRAYRRFLGLFGGREWVRLEKYLR